MSVLLATLRRDWRLASRRPASLLLEALGIVVGVGLLLFIGRFVGRGVGGIEYFPFAAAGLPVLRMHGALGRAVQAIGIGRVSGTFEHAVSSPAPVPLVVLAELTFELLRGLVVAVLILLTAAAVGAPFVVTAAGLAGVAVGLVGAAALFAALGAALVGLVVVAREASSLLAVTGLLLPFVAGAYFPLGTLPGALEAVATALPFRFAVDLVRDGLQHGRLDPATVGGLAAGVAVLLPAGLAVAGWGIARARRSGALSGT